MSVCTWSYTEWTPYEVLRVPSNASISEIRAAFKRMALCTHPDKLPTATNSTNNTAATASSSSTLACTSAPVSFHAVKEASEVLLDPFLRAAYDAARSHALVREVGAVSDTFTLSEDFYLVELAAEAAEDDRVRVYQCECRCGGVYEVMRFTEAAPSAPRTVRCECDSCSLVVEVVMD